MPAVYTPFWLQDVHPLVGPLPCSPHSSLGAPLSGFLPPPCAAAPSPEGHPCLRWLWFPPIWPPMASDHMAQ